MINLSLCILKSLMKIKLIIYRRVFNLIMQMNFQLTSYLNDNGIRHRLTYPYTHEQNGSIERKHRHHYKKTYN